MIDGLARRYGKLPSEILINSNTMDLYIMDVAMSFEKYHNDKIQSNGKEPLPNYSTEELLDIFNRNKS